MKINKKKSQIRKVKFGKNVTIVEPVNLYECKIGDNCFIGPFVEIQKKCCNWEKYKDPELFIYM